MASLNSTALHDLLLKAIKNDEIDVVRLFLALGASVDGTDLLPFRPLPLAAHHGRLDILELLVSRGADISVTIPYKTQKGAVYQGVSGGAQSLALAAGTGQIDALKWLIQAGANPNSLDDDRRTPLMSACLCYMVRGVVEGERLVAARRLEMVRELLQAGSDPTLVDFNGATALMLASSTGDGDLVDLLVSEAPETLNQASSLDIPGGGGMTPLSVAAQHGKVMSVDRLVSLGANDKDIWATSKLSCLISAAEGGHVDVIRVLLGKGMNAIGPEEVISAAVMQAARFDQPQALQVLLSVPVRGEERQAHRAYEHDVSPLHIAAAYGCFRAMAVFLAAGADLGAVDYKGRRPIEVIATTLEFEEWDAKRDAGMERMMKRAPAFCARSWAWLSGDDSGVRGGSAMVIAPRHTATSPLAVRIFRPRNAMFFTTRFAR